MPQTSPESHLFATEYARLNAEQKLAVDTVDGPVMVMAGPGTGKTQILSLRIANIVRVTDTPADAILALTFTESAASNMRKRLVRMMGSAAYEVHIHTFHGLASTLIGKHPEYFPRILGSVLATDVDKLAIAERILRAHTGRHIKWYDNFANYASALLSAIDTLKREYISPALLSKHIADAENDFDSTPDLIHEKGAYKGHMKSQYKELQKQIEKNQELVSLYVDFEAAMEEAKLYDFTDMLTELVRACEHDADFLLQLQEEYQYVLVDEHQDSNNLQNRMVELLGSFHDNPNIFVVGDDKQSVYRFQGASPDYFYGFQKKYPGATIISLVNNYRSSQSVLDIAHALLPGDIDLSAKAGHSNVVADLGVYTDVGAELFALGKRIEGLLSDGVEPSEIAVLTRTNGDSGSIARTLDLEDIPYIIESDVDVSTNAFMREIFALFRVIYNPHDEKSLATVLYSSWSDCDVIDVARLMHAGDKKRVKTLIDIMSDKALLQAAHIENPKEFISLATAVSQIHQAAYTEHACDVFTRVFNEFSLIQSIPAGSVATTLALVQVLYDDVQSFTISHPRATFHEYVDYLQTLEDHGKKLKMRVSGGRPGYVRIMTAHKSKGLEFDHVFIPHLVDRKWGNRPNRDLIKILERVFDGIPDNQTNDDERRLLYVALTRARKQLHLSYAERSAEGSDVAPSLFLTDIGEAHVMSFDSAQLAAEYESEKLRALTQAVGTHNPDDTRSQFHEYLMTLLEKRPLAATHLNNYLADPWEYIMKNLIRVPELQSAPMLYGTAIHAALESQYKLVTVGHVPSLEVLIETFSKKLYGSPVSEADFVRLQAQGERTLTAWFAENQECFHNPGFSEYSLRGVIMGLSGIVLSGNIDRLEFVDGSDIHVRIIDFKTGKAKSRNDIMGATKTSDGNYYRQLQFYKLLMRYYREGQYTVDDLVLRFVEPKDNGSFAVEHFDVPESEVDELEETIETMIQSMRNGDYWDHTPDPKKCNFIEMVQKIRGF